MSDEEGNEEAMRQMMGFSSFGTSQRPKKERQEPTTGEFSASGANSAPLAKRAKMTNTKSKIPPLSSSPPTFWPASLPPPPNSAASIDTTSSAHSQRTASEQQPLPGGPVAFASTQDARYAPAPGQSTLPTNLQDARSGPPPGVLPVPITEDARYGPPPGVSPLPITQDARYAPPPGIEVPAQSPQEARFGKPLGRAEYTNPVTGISFTRQELNDLRVGKTNERGDLVYFKPSFVDPNPWAKLKGRGKVARKMG